MPTPENEKIERKSYPILDLKTDDQSGQLEAIVSVFHNTDAGFEKVMPGFFQKSIERKLPKGVWAHDWKQPIAKTLEARELLPGDPLLPPELKDLGGAYIKGQFNLETQRGREAYSDIKFGIIDEFSIGYKVLREGKDKGSGARELLEGDWKEWSPVLVGMNDQTRLLSIKNGSSDEGAEGNAVDLEIDGAGEGKDDMADALRRNEEALATLAAKIAELETRLQADEKVGAANSAEDVKKIKSIHDTAVSMEPSMCPGYQGKAAATQCACCANGELDCGCASLSDGSCSCHADCQKCMDNECAGLAAAKVDDKAGARNSATAKRHLMAIHAAAATLEKAVCPSQEKVDAVREQVVAIYRKALANLGTKSIYDSALADITAASPYQILCAFLETVHQIDRLEDASEGTDITVDTNAMLQEASAAMSADLLAWAQKRLSGDADSPEGSMPMSYYAAPPSSFKELSDGLVSEPLEPHLLAVVTAVREVAERGSAIEKAIEVLNGRVSEKQEFRNADGRPVSARVRELKAEIDQELEQARDRISGAYEKSSAVTIVDADDLALQASKERLRFERLRFNRFAQN